MVTTEVIFPLEGEIRYKYTHQNEVLEARHITLYAPSTRVLNKVAPIKQLFLRAIATVGEGVDSAAIEEAAAQEGPEATEQEKAQQLMMLITMSKDVDYTKFLLMGMDLLKTPDLALIDGEAKLTQSFLDILPMSLLEELTGAYLANFIAPSAYKA